MIKLAQIIQDWLDSHNNLKTKWFVRANRYLHHHTDTNGYFIEIETDHVRLSWDPRTTICNKVLYVSDPEFFEKLEEELDRGEKFWKRYSFNSGEYLSYFLFK